MNQKKNSDHFGSIPIAQQTDPSEITNGPNLSPQDSKTTFSRKLVPPKRKGSFFTRGAKILATGILIITGLYFLGGYFLFPYLIKTYGAQKLSELSGRPVTISRAGFNPLSLRLELGNSIVGPLTNNPVDTIDPVISFGHLVFELDPRSLLHKGLICNEFSLDQLYVHIAKNEEGSLNIVEIWNQLLPNPVEPGTKSKATTISATIMAYLKSHYSLNNISIINSEIIFTDTTTNKKHHVNNLHIAMPTLATINYKRPRIKPQFSAVINGRPVSSTDFQSQSPDSASIQFSLNMAEIDIMSYKSYLPASFRPIVHGGQADINMQITYNPLTQKADDQLKLSGAITLRKIILKESLGRTTVESVLLQGWVSPLSNNFYLNKLNFTEPNFSLTKSTKDSLYLSSPFNLIQDTLLSSHPPRRLSHLEIIGGQMQFINRASPKDTQHWQDINVIVSSKTMPLKPNSKEIQTSDFSFSGKKGPQTKLNIQGTISQEPFSVKGFFEAAELDFNSLADLSRWFSGTVISKGTASRLKSNFNYEKKSDNKHLFLLDNLQIRATDVLLAKENTPLARIDDWQSENGFFYTSNPVLHLGSVQIKKAKFYTYPPKALEPWQNLITLSTTQSNDKATTQAAISSLEVVDSAIIFNDTIADAEIHTLSQFTLSAPQIKQDGKNLFTASATANTSPIKASGAFSLNPFSATGHIRAEAIPAAFINRLFVPNQNYAAKGTLRLDGSFGLPNLSYEGAATLSDLSLSKPNYSFESRQLNSASVSVKTKPLALSLKQLSVERPHLSYTQEGKSPSLLSFFTTPPSSQTNNKPAIGLDSLYVRDGKLSLSNKLVSPQFDTVAEMIHGSFNRSAGQAQSIFSFKGQLDGGSPIIFKGTTTLFDNSKTLQAKYQISNYPADQKSSFLAPFLGHTIKKAQLNLAGTLQASQNTIDHALDISIVGLELGNAIDSNLIKIKGDLWKGAPLLQALLQINEGEIALPLSIKSTVPPPNFNAGEALINQFEKQLLKVRVSPFSFFDAKTQTGPIPPTIFFPTGSSILSLSSQELLHNLASQLSNRPLLEITITGHADSHSDRKALFDVKIVEINRRQRQHEAKLSQALSTSYGKEIIDQPLTDYKTSKAAHDDSKKKVSITDKILLELAQKRIEEVLQFLKNEGIPESQVTAGQTEIIDSQHLGRDGNRIDFSVGL